MTFEEPDHVVLTTGLAQPVERKGQRDGRECHETETERAVELLRLEFLVVHVLLAVRGQFDLGTDLVAARAHVDEDRHGERGEKDDGDDLADRPLRVGDYEQFGHQ